MENNINIFEMCIFQRMFMILYLDRTTDVEVLEIVKQNKHVWGLYKRWNYNILETWYEERENKTTDGRKDRRDKMQRKAKKDLDKWCDGLVQHDLYEMC